MGELTQKQLQKLVRNFYTRVQKDEVLGYIFNDVAKVDWDKHISLLAQFWSSVMLGAREYLGNPMLKHLELSRKTELTPEHFRHWLALFSLEAKSCLNAESAQLIIERATLIANAIQHRLLEAHVVGSKM
ncbi:MAG: group III truncated hemoglobin [Gammaproteobacteria bacterium]|nr:group III truncated hemoglobin [Gammaproteobacteria bacterium]